jgi:hypothetical protein
MSKAHLFYRFGQPELNKKLDETDISFVDIRKRFNFRSIQLGRWVTPEEQKRAAHAFYHALVTLMKILQAPENLISLRASLSLQYGRGGRPGVAAHYSPHERCFSLAKNAGPGSIAHEWFHALDHYLGSQAFQTLPSFDQGLNYQSKALFASKAWLLDAPMRRHPLNDLLSNCFKAILLDESGHAASQLVQNSNLIDKKLNQLYYSLPEELCARAFEAFVEDAGLADASLINRFLVKGSRHSEEARLGLYPEGEHRYKINQAFTEYFELLGAYLNSGL